MNTSWRPKVGLLGLTLDLYETLAPNLRVSREAWLRRVIIPALQRHAEVVFDSAVFRREEISATVKQFETAEADALLVLLLTYAPSQLALPALQSTYLPIVIWNTQELLAIDQSFTVPAMIDNHGVHGTQDLANVLMRAGVPFHYHTSHPNDERGLEELIDFFVAAAAVRRLRSARLGLLGYPFPGMGDLAVDTTHLASTLGCAWAILGVEDFIRRAAAASSSQVTALVAEYRQSYDVSPEVTDHDLRSTARAELALRGMVTDHQLHGFTYQFLAFGDDERSPTVPFVAASRLMAEGIGFGGEGDLVATAATSFLNWLNPPASFTEMFTIDFAGNRLLLSHMGEANVAMARRDRRVPLVARPDPITRTRDRQLALVTSFAPGPATLAALTLASAGQWRLIAAPVTIDDFGPLPGFCVPHCLVRPANDVRRFLTDYAQAGGPHHNTLCFGDARRRLRMAAKLINADYREI
jgi:L-arabinose isomerase